MALVVYQSVSEIENTRIPQSQIALLCAGYAIPGDLGGDFLQFVRQLSQPSTSGWLQSADGSYWQLVNKVITPQMFGAFAVGDAEHDDYPAISAAMAYANANCPAGANSSAIQLKFPAGKYYSSQTINITKGVKVVGENWGGAGSGEACTITFPIGVSGIFINELAWGAEVHGLWLFGSGGAQQPLGTTPYCHGIWNCADAVIENVTVRYFTGHGVYFDGLGSGYSPAGYASLTYVRGCQAGWNGLCGFYTQGGDANVIVFVNCTADQNLGWGIRCDNTLGGIAIGCHVAGNGRLPTGNTPYVSLVQYNGVIYGVVPLIDEYINGQNATATTTPGTSSSVWYPTTLPVSSAYPVYTPGTTYPSAGSYCSFVGPDVYLGCYSEGSSAPSYVTSPALVIGGEHGAGFAANFAGLRVPYLSASYPQDGGAAGNALALTCPLVSASIPFPGGDPGLTEQVNVTIGYNGWGQNNALSIWAKTVAPNRWMLQAQADLKWTYGTTEVQAFTGPTTARQFGSGVAQPSVPTFPKIGISDQIIVGVGSAPPSGPAGAGWIIYNSAPIPGGWVGWICTTGGANPIWKPFGAISA